VEKLKQKEIQQKIKEAQRKEKIKEMEEKNRLREWESEVNTQRLKRKRKHQHEEMQKKLQKFEVKVEKFKRDKKLVMMRGQYNILVSSIRKLLLKERFHEMEIKTKFESEILNRIDLDFKKALIEENDDRIDELQLQDYYTNLFNLLGAYQKMFQEQQLH